MDVFRDQYYRQVGFISCRADIVDNPEISPARPLIHRMNDPVSWLQQELDAGEIGRLVGSANQHRIPLVDNSKQVCGAVVLEAAARTGRQRVAPTLRHRAVPALNPRP